MTDCDPAKEREKRKKIPPRRKMPSSHLANFKDFAKEGKKDMLISTPII
jgi:hypothetical protein